MLCQHFRYRHRQRLHRQVHHRCVVGIFDFKPMQLTNYHFFFNIYPYHQDGKCTARTQMLCQHFRYRHRQRLHRQVHHRCVVGIFEALPMQVTNYHFFSISITIIRMEKKNRKNRRGKQSNAESLKNKLALPSST